MIEPLSHLSLALLVWSAHGLACLCFGLALLRPFGVGPAAMQTISAAGYISLAFALGQAIFGVLWQTLAAIGLFSPAAIIASLSVGILAGLPTARQVQAPIRARMRAVLTDARRETLVWRGLAAVICLLVLILGLLTLHPPGTDALAFYLAQTKLIAETHHMVPLPFYEGFAVIGLAAEMHFAALQSLSGEIAAKMAVWPTALASAGLLWAIGAEVGLGRRGQWVLVAMLYTSSAFTLVLWDGKSDLFATAWGLAAIYVVLLIGRLPNRAGLPLAGLMTGLAMTAKLSLIAAMAPMLAILLAWRLWPRGARPAQAVGPVLSAGIVFGLWALAGALPMVLKNAIVFAEPLAPFWQFGDGPTLNLAQVWFSPENTRWIVMTYPLAVVFGDYPMQHGNLTPLWLAFLPLALLLPRPKIGRPGPLAILTLASLAGVLAWVALRPSILAPRYFLPPLLTLLPMAAFAAERAWSRKDTPWVRAAISVAVIGIVLVSALDLAPRLNRGRKFAGLTRSGLDDETFAAARFINETAGSGVRMHLAMYPRSFFRSDLLQCVLSRDEMATVRQAGAADPAALWTTLHTLGAGLLVFDGITHAEKFDRRPDPAAAPNWLEIAETRYAARDITIYAMTPLAGAPPPEHGCVPQGGRLWRPEQQF